MESVGGALDWVQQNSRMLLGVVASIVVVAIIAAAVYSYNQRREARADEALAGALRVYQATIDPAAANPDDPTEPVFGDTSSRAAAVRDQLTAVRDDFGGSDAAGIATAYLGQLAIESGDAEQARALWEEFVKGSGDNMLAAEVRVNLMGLDRAEGKGDELVTRLRAMLSGPDDGLPHDLLWYELASTLEGLGRDEEARDAYQHIVADFPQSAYAGTARQRTGESQAPLFGG